jgi:AcrR family transcriptional regulator
MPFDRTVDRRVQKTRSLLHGALAALVHEKSYDAIVVKEILGRANVGRSTFYSHFRDKEDLLLSAIRELLAAGGAAAASHRTDPARGVLRFSLPVLEHVERVRAGAGSRTDGRRQAALHERLEEVLIEQITADLRRVGRRVEAGVPGVPPGLLARHVAATFLLVLDWWVERGESLTARDADDVFRALVLPAVTSAVGSGPASASDGAGAP